MQNAWKSLVLLGLFAVMAGCATIKNTTPAGTNATATDESADRILVTVEMLPPAGVTGLSPSGRLDYLPPGAMALENTHRRQAEKLADEFELQLEEDWPIPALGVYCFVFRLPGSEADHAGQVRDRPGIIAALERHPDVESAQPLNFFYAQSDPLSHSPASSTPPYGHVTGRDVSVAVIDTGADLQHEDLAGADITAFDLVGDQRSVPAEHHGTSVLGIIAARRDNGKGVSGYAPAAEITLLRACWEPDARDERAVCNTFTLAKALSQALQTQAAIVNLSIAGPRDPLLERLAGLLVESGGLLVAAGTSRDTFPASVTGSVIASRAVPAAGSGVITLMPGDRYALRSGSSLSAARVSGIAALIREIAPQLSAADLRQRLNGETIDSTLAGLLKATSNGGRALKASATH